MAEANVARRDMLMWYPMRVAYGDERRLLHIKEKLEEEHLKTYLPMRYLYEKTDDWDVRQRLVPAIYGLIFVYSTQSLITELKMTRREFQPLRYFSNQFSEAGDDHLLTVPVRQMENFIKVTSVKDDHLVYLDYNGDFLLKPGKKVRITDGPFKGAEGEIKRIKKSQCVVVQVDGVAAVAITFVPKAWLELI